MAFLFVLILFSTVITPNSGLPRPATEVDVWKQVPGLLECDSSRPMSYKIADSNQCDKYYICNNGEVIPQFCPDGTVFQFSIQNCILMSGADCSGRPILQQPLPGKQCPRRTGLFPHEDPRKCNQYYQCLDGRPLLITCPDMLLFDPVRGVCDYEDLVNTTHCDLPPPPVVCPATGQHDRLPHPTDCRRFFLCETERPRPLACEDDQGFDITTRSCIDRHLVDRCKMAN